MCEFAYRVVTISIIKMSNSLDFCYGLHLQVLFITLITMKKQIFSHFLMFLKH